MSKAAKCKHCAWFTSDDTTPGIDDMEKLRRHHKKVHLEKLKALQAWLSGTTPLEADDATESYRA